MSFRKDQKLVTDLCMCLSGSTTGRRGMPLFTTAVPKIGARNCGKAAPLRQCTSKQTPTPQLQPRTAMSVLVRVAHTALARAGAHQRGMQKPVPAPIREQKRALFSPPVFHSRPEGVASRSLNLKPGSSSIWNEQSTQFEESRTLLDRRRKAERPDKALTPKAQSFILATATMLAKSDPDGKANPSAIAWLLQNYRKGGTFNQYAPAFEEWAGFCAEKDAKPLPANPWLVAEYLQLISARANNNGHTASVIDRHCSAISMASKLTNLQNPMEHVIVSMARESSRRLLGYRKRKAYPLKEKHIIRFWEIFCSLKESAPEDVCFMTLVAVAWEACLRWDDLCDSQLGDMIWTDSYVKILLINTKTDAYKTGQWCMILVSSLPHSAYQMLVRMVTYLCDSPAFKRSGINVAEAPIAMPFVTENNVRVPNPASRLTYDHVNNKLKAWCEKAGLSPSLFSTHSWKRGGINERVERGVPDRFTKLDGRWRSEISFEGYCDDEITLFQRVQALRSFRPK